MTDSAAPTLSSTYATRYEVPCKCRYRDELLTIQRNAVGGRWIVTTKLNMLNRSGDWTSTLSILPPNVAWFNTPQEALEAAWSTDDFSNSQPQPNQKADPTHD